MIEATTASATALGSHLLRTAAAMIENLFHPADKHLRPPDIPKALYLPRAEFFFFYDGPAPAPAYWPAAIHLPAHKEKHRAPLYEREPLHPPAPSTLRPTR